jgi:hypothetical protein
VASLETQITAVLLPADFHRRVCGRLCRWLPEAAPGTVYVLWLRADGSAVDAGETAGSEGTGPREVGVFGARRLDGHRWQVAVVTADGTWFHGEYTDARLLRQRSDEAPEPLRSLLSGELALLA